MSSQSGSPIKSIFGVSSRVLSRTPEADPLIRALQRRCFKPRPHARPLQRTSMRSVLVTSRGSTSPGQTPSPKPSTPLLMSSVFPLREKLRTTLPSSRHPGTPCSKTARAHLHILLCAPQCAAATPPTQFGSEKARGRSYLRLLVDFCRTLLATNHYSTTKLRNSS